MIDEKGKAILRDIPEEIYTYEDDSPEETEAMQEDIGSMEEIPASE